MMIEQEPTHSVEIEMALLGSFMLDPNAFRLTRGIVNENSFYRPSHKDIYRAIAHLEAKGQTTERSMVQQWLEDKGFLTDLGGQEYLEQVEQYVPSPASAVHYANSVAEKAELRAYSSACRNVVAEISKGEDIDKIRSLVLNLPQSFKRSSAFIDLADIDHTGADVGITTGISGIDRAISTRGYPDGQTSIVSAYHKAGKSTFMIQSFVHMAELGHRVLYATFADLNAKRLKRRMIRALCGWSKRPDDFQANQAEITAYDNALAAVERIWEGSIFDASKSQSDTIEGFLSQLEAMHLDRPYNCVFIDYAQKLTSDNPRAKNGGTAEGDWCSHVVSKAAEKLGVAIVVGSQITEGGKDNRTITKGSRKWEEDAGLVLRIKREGEDKAEITLEFSRFGGMGTEIACNWDSKTLTFTEATV